MARTGCGVQAPMLVLHGFAPAMDVTSHLLGNLLEISPVIHRPSSLPHKGNQAPLAHSTCTPYRPTRLHKVSLGFSFCSLL